MSEAVRRLREAVIARAVTTDAHRAAFRNEDVPPALRGLIDKVTRHAYKVTDEDIAAAKAAGFTEDQIFELCVSAALGESKRQLDAALAALEATP